MRGETSPFAFLINAGSMNRNFTPLAHVAPEGVDVVTVLRSPAAWGSGVQGPIRTGGGVPVFGAGLDIRRVTLGISPRLVRRGDSGTAVDGSGGLGKFSIRQMGLALLDINSAAITGNGIPQDTSRGHHKNSMAPHIDPTAISKYQEPSITRSRGSLLE